MPGRRYPDRAGPADARPGRSESRPYASRWVRHGSARLARRRRRATPLCPQKPPSRPPPFARRARTSSSAARCETHKAEAPTRPRRLSDGGERAVRPRQLLLLVVHEQNVVGPLGLECAREALTQDRPAHGKVAPRRTRQLGPRSSCRASTLVSLTSEVSFVSITAPWPRSTSASSSSTAANSAPPGSSSSSRR